MKPNDSLVVALLSGVIVLAGVVSYSDLRAGRVPNAALLVAEDLSVFTGGKHPIDPAAVEVDSGRQRSIETGKKRGIVPSIPCPHTTAVCGTRSRDSAPNP